MGKILAVSEGTLQTDLNHFKWYVEANVNKLREKLLHKYKDLDLNEPSIKISITENGNLMLHWKKLTFAVTEDGVKLNRQNLAKSIQSICQYNPKYKQYSAIKHLVSHTSIYNTGDPRQADGLKILTYKLILTKDGVPYFVSKNKLRRLSKESLLKNYSPFIQALFNVPGMETYSDGLLNMVDSETDSQKYLIVLYEYFKKMFPIIEYLDADPSLNNILAEKDYSYHLRNLLSSNVNMQVLTSNICDYPKYVRKLLGKYSLYSKEHILIKYMHLNKIKFTNTEVIKEILTDGSATIMTSNYHQNEFIKHMRKFYKDKNINIDKLIIDRFKTEGLTHWELDDIFRMFTHCLFRRRIMKDKKFPELDIARIFKNNLKDVHDYLSEVNRSDLAIENYQEYKNITFELDDAVGDYLFFQPRDSVELTRLASIMNNCVAGYNDKIKRNECKIIYAVSKNCPKVIDYIRNGMGELKPLQVEIKNQKLPQTLCIELLSKTEDYSTLDYVNALDLQGGLLLLNNKNKFDLNHSYVNQNFTYSNYIPSGLAMEASKEYFRKHNIKYDYEESIPSWCHPRIYPAIA